MTETEESYFKICAWRLLHPLSEEEYGELHHILPKSCGGPNRKWNLVRLTPEEHYECHRLLPTLFKERGWKKEYRRMLTAWNMMHYRFGMDRLSPEKYAALKQEYAVVRSVEMSGDHHPFYGKHHTPEMKAHLSKVQKGKRGHKMSEEAMRKIAEYRRGRSHSAETKKKIGNGVHGASVKRHSKTFRDV